MVDGKLLSVPLWNLSVLFASKRFHRGNVTIFVEDDFRETSGDGDPAHDLFPEVCTERPVSARSLPGDDLWDAR